MGDKETIELGTFGAFAVGKSCFVIQFVKNTFVEDHDPTMEDFYETSKKVGDSAIDFTIYDTSGNEQYTALADEHMQTVEGFFLIYSVIDEGSFEKIKTLQQKITLVKKTKNVPIVLVGNKVDLVDDRKVSTEKGQQLANDFGCAFIETSAKTRYNIDAAFELMVQQVQKARSTNNNGSSTSRSSTLSPSSDSKQSGKSPAKNGKDKCALQ